MKYLICIKPNKKLIDLILEQEHIKIPQSGIHNTLATIYMNAKYEAALIKNLSKINFNPFEIKTTGFEKLDKNTLALKISSSKELLKLHQNIVSIVNKYAHENFKEIKQKYYLDKYNPHLRIAEANSLFDKESKILLNNKTIITEYILMKGNETNREIIKTFYSKKTVFKK